jgi:hypothetical protein
VSLSQGRKFKLNCVSIEIKYGGTLSWEIFVALLFAKKAAFQDFTFIPFFKMRAFFK